VEVTLGSRDVARATETAARLGQAYPAARITGASNREAISSSEVVVLTVPFGYIKMVLEQQLDAFQPGALVIDVTVPVVFESGRPRFAEPAEGSAGECVRRLLPDQVAVACAFKTLPATLLRDPTASLDCDEFVCGDSKATRDRAMGVVRRIHKLRPIDVGPLDAAQIVEKMAWLAIMLNRRYKSHDARFRVVGLDV
jgi:NADPH-dependent F420 reductase